MKFKTLVLFLILFAMTATDVKADDGKGPATLRLYDLEYGLIPMYAQQLLPGELYENAFLDLDTMFDRMLPQMNLKPDFDRSTMKAEPFVRGDYRGVVYTYPEPQEMPQAKYGVVVFTSPTQNRYFTLEMSLDFGGTEEVIWVLGEKRDDLREHINHGNVPACATPADFIDILEKGGFLAPLPEKEKEK